MYEHYHEFAEKINPVLRVALAGELEVPEQKPFSEAWLAYAMFPFEKSVPLEEIIGSADAINHGIPKADEVASAFLRLRKRGWLVVQGDLYGLTAEGRRAVNTVVAQAGVRGLKEWISAHPPRTEE